MYILYVLYILYLMYFIFWDHTIFNLSIQISWIESINWSMLRPSPHFVSRKRDWSPHQGSGFSDSIELYRRNEFNRRIKLNSPNWIVELNLIYIFERPRTRKHLYIDKKRIKKKKGLNQFKSVCDTRQQTHTAPVATAQPPHQGSGFSRNPGAHYCIWPWLFCYNKKIK